MSTVTVAPIEEKVAVLDDKAKPVKPRGTSNRDYAMKFVCAAMSSKYPLCFVIAYPHRGVAQTWLRRESAIHRMCTCSLYLCHVSVLTMDSHSIKVCIMRDFDRAFGN